MSLEEKIKDFEEWLKRMILILLCLGGVAPWAVMLLHGVDTWWMMVYVAGASTVSMLYGMLNIKLAGDLVRMVWYMKDRIVITKEGKVVIPEEEGSIF